MKGILRAVKNQLIAPPMLSILHRFGVHISLNSPDRKFLEQQIIGKLLAAPELRRVLFAGVEIYTWHYKYLLADKDLYTIDWDKSKKRYGNGDAHVIGSVCNLDQFYSDGQFDVVIFNGLIGYGLDAAAEVDRALKAAHAVLREGGILIIGWNNTPRHLTFSLDELPGYRLFATKLPPGIDLSSHRHEISQVNRHTFDFLTKVPRAC
jgi:SAM-dependent methyltransferase